MFMAEAMNVTAHACIFITLLSFLAWMAKASVSTSGASVSAYQFEPASSFKVISEAHKLTIYTN